MSAAVSRPRRLARGIMLALVMEALVIALSGRVDLPMLHAFAGLCAVLAVAVILLVDPELLRERLRGGQAGEDPARLVIRVQSERRHHVVSTGPYATVRHPGYAGMALAAPAAALAIGSWGALVLGLALTVTLVARVVHEDRFLTASLAGYPDYAARVRFRLLPGAW